MGFREFLLPEKPFSFFLQRLPAKVKHSPIRIALEKAVSLFLDW